MIKQILVICSFVILAITAVPELALAQFDIKPILKAGPVKVSAGLDGTISLSAPDERTALVNITSFASIHEIQSIIDAFIPEINANLACRKGHAYGAIARTASLSNQNNTLLLKVEASGVTCYPLSVSVSFDIAVPITVQIVNNSIHLVAAPAKIQPTGFFAGLIGIGGGVEEVGKQLNPGIAKLAQQFNSMVDKEFSRQMLQKQIRLYNLKLSSAGVFVDTGDLKLTLTVLGQVPISTLVSKEMLF
jgi:hypothetical protein